MVQKYYFCGMEKNMALTIESNVELKSLNTFGIQSTAKHLIRLTSENELSDVLRYVSGYQGKVLFIGGGSNILFTKNWDGLIVKVETKGIELLDEDNDFVYVRAHAGEIWDDLVNYCIQRGYGGLENLSLIPGTVGSSPIQNIGAYGVELKDVFYLLEAVSTRTGEFREFDKNECQFGYRYSIFKGEYRGVYIILSVVLKLTKNPALNVSYGVIRDEIIRLQLPMNIESISKAVTNIRRSKLPDPSEIGNAGSFFKNPVINNDQFNELKDKFPELKYFMADSGYKVAAGWLIENCGWKGFREGDVGVHKNQALVLVNYGNGNGSQIRDLAKKISDSVLAKFGIQLEPEVNIV